MARYSELLYGLTHLEELRGALQWRYYHARNVAVRGDHDMSSTLQTCFVYLDKTSRSFARVIRELNDELLNPICLFYLILRGLDTIEDDMSISVNRKVDLLREFHNVLDCDGWSFTGVSPTEKDRDLLVHFNVVIREFKLIKPEYQDVIRDITQKMGHGMAEFAVKAAQNSLGVNSIAEYNLYCHYVAGLVGEGLTRLFILPGFANKWLSSNMELCESMGQLLQQVNIIRDVHEDWQSGRRFWPREVWSQYVGKFDDLFEPENSSKALQCSSEMIALALERVGDCLVYLANLTEQSVFNFAAIPQTMAIATLELCFRNPDIFRRSVKIHRVQAGYLMEMSTKDMRTLCMVFRRHLCGIRRRNDPVDGSFTRISIVCGKIEQMIEAMLSACKSDTIIHMPNDHKGCHTTFCQSISGWYGKAIGRKFLLSIFVIMLSIIWAMGTWNEVLPRLIFTR